MSNFGRIPDEVGHLLVNEDGAIIASGGELENNESIANTILSLLSCTTKAQLFPNDSDSFKRITISYIDHSYVVCLSNRNIHIVKRRTFSTEPVQV